MIQATTQTEGRPSGRFLWILMLAGPVIWAVYFVMGYGLAEGACKTNFLGFNLLGLAALSIVEIILTVMALGLVLYSGFLAYRIWQQWGGETGLDPGEPVHFEEPRRFMIFVALLMDGLFSLIILLTGLPAFILQPCINY